MLGVEGKEWTRINYWINEWGLQVLWMNYRVTTLYPPGLIQYDAVLVSEMCFNGVCVCVCVYVSTLDEQTHSFPPCTHHS
jgi:hypothetical protein